MPLDFRADRVQTKALIADRSSGAKLIIYPSDAKLDNNGGIDPTKLPPAQYEADDVFIFISGSIGGLDGVDNGVSVFGGDVYVSGSLAGETLIFNNLVGEQVMVNFVPLLNVDQVLGQKVYFSQVGDIATYSGQVEYKSVAPGNSVLTINLSANGLVEVPSYTGEISGVSSTHYAEDALAMGTNSTALIYEESGDQYIYISSDSVGSDGIHSAGFTISFRNPMGSASGGGGGGGGGDASDWAMYPAVQNVGMDGKRITNMAEPVLPSDAATKKYIDDINMFESPDGSRVAGMVEENGEWIPALAHLDPPGSDFDTADRVAVIGVGDDYGKPIVHLGAADHLLGEESRIDITQNEVIFTGKLTTDGVYTPVDPEDLATKKYVDENSGGDGGYIISVVHDNPDPENEEPIFEDFPPRKRLVFMDLEGNGIPVMDLGDYDSTLVVIPTGGGGGSEGEVGGDLSGNLPNPTVTGIHGTPIPNPTSSYPSIGQPRNKVLTYDYDMMTMGWSDNKSPTPYTVIIGTGLDVYKSDLIDPDDGSVIKNALLSHNGTIWMRPGTYRISSENLPLEIPYGVTLKAQNGSVIFLVDEGVTRHVFTGTGRLEGIEVRIINDTADATGTSVISWTKCKEVTVRIDNLVNQGELQNIIQSQIIEDCYVLIQTAALTNTITAYGAHTDAYIANNHAYGCRYFVAPHSQALIIGNRSRCDTFLSGSGNGAVVTGNAHEQFSSEPPISDALYSNMVISNNSFYYLSSTFGSVAPFVIRGNRLVISGNNWFGYSGDAELKAGSTGVTVVGNVLSGSSIVDNGTDNQVGFNIQG